MKGGFVNRNGHRRRFVSKCGISAVFCVKIDLWAKYGRYLAFGVF